MGDDEKNPDSSECDGTAMEIVTLAGLPTVPLEMNATEAEQRTVNLEFINLNSSGQNTKIIEVTEVVLKDGIQVEDYIKNGIEAAAIASTDNDAAINDSITEFSSPSKCAPMEQEKIPAIDVNDTQQHKGIVTCDITVEACQEASSPPEQQMAANSISENDGETKDVSADLTIAEKAIKDLSDDRQDGVWIEEESDTTNEHSFHCMDDEVSVEILPEFSCDEKPIKSSLRKRKPETTLGTPYKIFSGVMRSFDFHIPPSKQETKQKIPKAPKKPRMKHIRQVPHSLCISWARMLADQKYVNCPIPHCERFFRHHKILKRHYQWCQADQEDSEKCPFCTKNEVRVNGDLVKHVKQHHLEKLLEYIRIYSSIERIPKWKKLAADRKKEVGQCENFTKPNAQKPPPSMKTFKKKSTKNVYLNNETVVCVKGDRDEEIDTRDEEIDTKDGNKDQERENHSELIENNKDQRSDAGIHMSETEKQEVIKGTNSEETPSVESEPELQHVNKGNKSDDGKISNRDCEFRESSLGKIALVVDDGVTTATKCAIGSSLENTDRAKDNDMQENQYLGEIFDALSKSQDNNYAQEEATKETKKSSLCRQQLRASVYDTHTTEITDSNKKPMKERLRGSLINSVQVLNMNVNNDNSAAIPCFPTTIVTLNFMNKPSRKTLDKTEVDSQPQSYQINSDDSLNNIKNRWGSKKGNTNKKNKNAIEDTERRSRPRRKCSKESSADDNTLEMDSDKEWPAPKRSRQRGRQRNELPFSNTVKESSR